MESDDPDLAGLSTHTDTAVTFHKVTPGEEEVEGSEVISSLQIAFQGQEDHAYVDQGQFPQSSVHQVTVFWCIKKLVNVSVCCIEQECVEHD